MNISTPENLSASLWRRLISCSLLVLVTALIVKLRLSYLQIGPSNSGNPIVELTCWRLGLLLTFQSAPLILATFIYKGYKRKLIRIPLYQTMAILRMPLAVWSGGCLLIALALWPELNGLP